MFRACDLVERILVSARTGEGVEAWCDWLRAAVPRPRRPDEDRAAHG